MRKLLLPILLFAAFPLLYAQCPNLDFSYHDFSNWKCYISDSWATGQTCYDSLQWKYVTPAVDGRHTIMSDIYAVDERTCDNGMSPLQLPLVPDGYRYSARIGNPNTGSDAESIRYRIAVDSTNYWVTVRYAAVLEIAQHWDERESPRFGIRFQDTAGKPLPVGNLELSVKDTAQLIKCYGVYWKDWDELGVNLAQWIGQTVELVIYAMDCGKGGHYGYGYAVCECGTNKPTLIYCQRSQKAILEAANGYKSYVGRTVAEMCWILCAKFHCKCRRLTHPIIAFTQIHWGFRIRWL